MARLLFTDYLQRRDRLTEAWKYRPSSFSYLSFAEQRSLHDYYRLTERLTEGELHNHWQAQRYRAISLPQRAGRAYKALLPLFTDSLLQPQPTGNEPVQQEYVKKEDRIIAIRGQARPQVDMEKVARLLLELAREELKKERDQMRD